MKLAWDTAAWESARVSNTEPTIQVAPKLQKIRREAPIKCRIAAPESMNYQVNAGLKRHGAAQRKMPQRPEKPGKRPVKKVLIAREYLGDWNPEKSQKRGFEICAVAYPADSDRSKNIFERARIMGPERATSQADDPRPLPYPCPHRRAPQGTPP